MGLYIKSAFWLLLLDFSSKCTKMCLVVWLPTDPLTKLYTYAGNGREKRKEVAGCLA